MYVSSEPTSLDSALVYDRSRISSLNSPRLWSPEHSAAADLLVNAIEARLERESAKERLRQQLAAAKQVFLSEADATDAINATLTNWHSGSQPERNSLSITVTGHQKSSVDGHIDYILQVQNLGKQWLMRKRYSQLDALARELAACRKSGDGSIPAKLPGKTGRTFFGAVSETFILDRESGLQSWMRAVTQTAWAAQSTPLMLFCCSSWSQLHVSPGTPGTMTSFPTGGSPSAQPSAFSRWCSCFFQQQQASAQAIATPPRQ